jgi:hypothetical protein
MPIPFRSERFNVDQRFENYLQALSANADPKIPLKKATLAYKCLQEHMLIALSDYSQAKGNTPKSNNKIRGFKVLLDGGHINAFMAANARYQVEGRPAVGEEAKLFPGPPTHTPGSLSAAIVKGFRAAGNAFNTEDKKLTPVQEMMAKHKNSEQQSVGTIIARTLNATSNPGSQQFAAENALQATLQIAAENARHQQPTHSSEAPAQKKTVRNQAAIAMYDKQRDPNRPKQMIAKEIEYQKIMKEKFTAVRNESRKATLKALPSIEEGKEESTPQDKKPQP